MENQDNINKVKAGIMSSIEFLKSSDEWENYTIWCKEHAVEPDDISNADLYFEQMFASDYDESQVLMEI